jgi:hypothetical protein
MCRLIWIYTGRTRVKIYISYAYISRKWLKVSIALKYLIIFYVLQDSAVSNPRSRTAFFNVSVIDENDNSAAFISTNCQTDSRGFCVGARYSTSIVSGQTVCIPFQYCESCITIPVILYSTKTDT